MTRSAATFQFSLVKGAERYVVRCGTANAERAIGQLMDWAEDPDLDFDWFDAAVLARQISQRQAAQVGGDSSEVSGSNDAADALDSTENESQD